MRTPPEFEELKCGPRHIHIHGHRGARGILPENTLEGFRFTFGIGVRIVELDIFATCEGTPVITHNPRLSPYSTRSEDGSWLQAEGPLISELTDLELSRFDVGGLQPGSEYANRYPDQAFMPGLRVPLLGDLCRMISANGYQDTWLNVEIKSHPMHPENTPSLPVYVERILSVIDEAEVGSRVVLQSFDWRILHECARQMPEIPRSYLTYTPKPNPPRPVNVYEDSPWMDGLSLAAHGNSLPDLIASDGGQVWGPFHHDLTAEDLAAARNNGLLVNVWTVNEFADIERMIDLKVDGIITDYPGRVQRRLLDHGMTWTPPRHSAAEPEGVAIA
ncbi:MAG: glycerophosphodiester phosphodiesterase [Hyphomicrobiales bacterium]|nr:glycerophosphodiester phosphodiesterase [Hyphomicrobiales bacterium]